MSRTQDLYKMQEREGNESGEESQVNPSIDASLYLPFVFTSVNGMSFEGVVDGENMFPLELRPLTLDGRDGGLMMGARVAKKFPECRLDFSSSVRRRPWLTLSDLVWLIRHWPWFGRVHRRRRCRFGTGRPLASVLAKFGIPRRHPDGRRGLKLEDLCARVFPPYYSSCTITHLEEIKTER